MPKITIATTCMKVVHNKGKNLEKYIDFIDQAASKGANLILFPEQSLMGYLTNVMRIDKKDLTYQQKNAETVPDGESIKRLIGKAREKDMYIAFGFTERSTEEPNVLFNSMALVGPEGLIGVHRKVHQPRCEYHVFFPGDTWSVYDTNIGKIGMLICYDTCFPEATRELALGGTEICLFSTAWPSFSAFFGDETGKVEEDACLRVYDVFSKTRAIENQFWFVTSNIVGQHGEHTYIGHSRIIAPDGEIVTEAGYEEGLAMATVDVQEEIAKHRSGRWMFPNLLRDRRPETYSRIPCQPLFHKPREIGATRPQT